MVPDPKRKLAAIMFTDMLGYTAMMQEDERKAKELKTEPHIFGEKELKNVLYLIKLYQVVIFYVKLFMIKERTKKLRDSQLW